jgi:FSR family fosmidomycin resistance protein-like MFS transporter
LILSTIGLAGIYGLALLALPLLLFIFYAMRQTQADLVIPPPTLTLTPNFIPETTNWAGIWVLALLVGLRSWAFLGTVTFLPKIFQDKDWTATGYGLITGAFWFASALTGTMAGGLADRWGRRQVVFATLLLGSVSLYFLPLYSGWAAFPLAILSGGLLGASHSILVVIAQDLVPGPKAFASGITLGYLFGVGAIAAASIGALAETWGLALIIQAGAGLGLGSALLALFLPKTRSVSQIQPEGALV